jgi:hypothetical protein
MEGPMPGETGIALEETIEQHQHEHHQDSSNSSALDLEKSSPAPAPARTVHGFKVIRPLSKLIIVGPRHFDNQ